MKRLPIVSICSSLLVLTLVSAQAHGLDRHAVRLKSVLFTVSPKERVVLRLVEGSPEAPTTEITVTFFNAQGKAVARRIAVAGPDKPVLLALPVDAPKDGTGYPGVRMVVDLRYNGDSLDAETFLTVEAVDQRSGSVRLLATHTKPQQGPPFLPSGSLGDCGGGNGAFTAVPIE